jgi:predicted transcriptional regulator
MGIFKKLINKILDAEVPPAIEKLVKKGFAKKEYTEEQAGGTKYHRANCRTL